jgi:hypothetical protein
MELRFNRRRISDRDRELKVHRKNIVALTEKGREKMKPQSL